MLLSLFACLQQWERSLLLYRVEKRAKEDFLKHNCISATAYEASRTVARRTEDFVISGYGEERIVWGSWWHSIAALKIIFIRLLRIKWSESCSVVWLFCDSMDFPVHGISRLEYWSGQPFLQGPPTQDQKPRLYITLFCLCKGTEGWGWDWDR